MRGDGGGRGAFIRASVVYPSCKVYGPADLDTQRCRTSDGSTSCAANSVTLTFLSVYLCLSDRRALEQSEIEFRGAYASVLHRSAGNLLSRGRLE